MTIVLAPAPAPALAASGDVALLLHDVELRGAVDAADLPFAERAVRARRLTLADGRWTPEPG